MVASPRRDGDCGVPVLAGPEGLSMGRATFPEGGYGQGRCRQHIANCNNSPSLSEIDARNHTVPSMLFVIIEQVRCRYE